MLKVTLLSSEWKSTKGGLSTICRELAIQLAKHPNVEVSVFLPQFSEEDKKIAASYNVKLFKAQELPGYKTVVWLASIPENHAMDCIIAHGVPLGLQVPLMKRHNHHCKWIQIVHTAPEELGMYKTYTDAISKGEEKLQTEIKLCEMADQVVAVGPKLADAISCSLPPSEKEVITLIPGISTEFSEVKQATEERNNFVVLVFGCGDSEDLELKGYDIAAKAIAELNDMSCHLLFVGVPSAKEEEVRNKFLDYGISPAQLTVRCSDESREQLAKLLGEVDLAIMPSRTEGFGMTALEALSAGLPVLVSCNSGLGEAFKKVAFGSIWIVASEEPKDWAKAISAVQEKDRDVRLEECETLREKYGAKYSWQKQCYSLVETMQKISFGKCSVKLQFSKLTKSLSCHLATKW